MKICSRCKVEKLNTEFRKKSSAADGLDYSCKPCVDEYNNTWKKNNPDKRAIISRKTTLKTKYGITEEQYDLMLLNQMSSCALCGKHESEFNKKLAIDHDHHTGQIRGLLCYYCNHKLIGRHRDADLLRKMADYVSQGTGLYVPEKTPKRRTRKN